jgi:transposase
LRHGTTNLFAALDFKPGTVIGQFHRRHRAVEFRQFLETIGQQIPSRFALHLIIDNYATHKTPAIKRWLLRHPRFHLHFTPTGASWLNLVERWFAGLTEKQLRRGVHHSTRELQDAIRHYLELNNRHPNPFIWTKTAHQILESVARFCKRTSGSGHSARSHCNGSDLDAGAAR